ncbi:MAG: cytochrome C oxidase subunit IV family protein [Bryobacterales bacterium]|jgi:cytochrome c oxidase subunit IV|nr:cytochrome C oxidase subunit IV family protein [Bryobacterales bacterium]
MSDTTHHVVPVRVYLLVFASLLVLTYLTVAISYVDLGVFNALVAMAIAVTKAMAVILWFMHVKYSTRLTKLCVGGGFLWLMFLFALTMMDYISRNWKF